MTRRSLWMTLAVGLLLAAVPAWSADIAALTKQLREGDAKARAEARTSLVLEGVPALNPLLDLVGDENLTIDREAQVGLLKLVMDLARPDVAPERRGQMVQALAERAKSGNPVQRKVAIFLLGRAGDARAVGALAALLRDAGLREDARRALTLISGPEATQALAAALSDADAALKVGLLGSLGRRQAAETLDDVVQATKDTAPEVRLAAVEALGRLGNAKAELILRKLRESSNAATRAAARTAYLDLACALVSLPGKTPARAMLEWASADAGSEGERAAALVGLTRLPEPPLDVLVDALLTGSDQVKAAVAGGLVDARAPGVTSALARALREADPESKVVWLRVLQERGDPRGLLAVEEALGDASPAARAAASTAMARLGYFADVPRLVAALADPDPEVRKAARDTLKVLKGTMVTYRITSLLPAADPATKKALVEILGDRRDPEAIGTLVAMGKDADEGVAMAALKSLGKLNYSYAGVARVAEAADAMIALLKGGSEDLKMPAAWAVMRMGAGLKRADTRRSLAVYRQALALAPSDDERAMALEGMGGFGDPETLDLIRPYLEKPELRAPACAAVVPIASALADAGKRDEAISLYRTAMAGLKDRNLIRAAADRLRGLGEEVDLAGEAGYVTRWFVLGPFGKRAEIEARDVIDPAARANTAAPVAVGENRHAWKYVEVDDPTGLLDLERAVARQNDVVAYVYAEVRTEKAQDTVFHFGSDDSFVCWVNGKKASEFLGDRAYAPDQNKAEVRLNAGRNSIMVRVGQGGAQWSVSLRIADKEGKPLRLAQKSDLDQAGEQGALTTWWALGPFAGQDALKEKDAIATDRPVDAGAAVAAGENTLRWRSVRAVRASGMVDLNRDVARGEDRGCYAYAEVECAQGGDALLQIGSDDGVVCWLNGKEVHRNIVPRPYAADQDQAKVQLKAGKNTLLLKILQGAGDWAFGVRITTPEGTPFVITQKAPGVFTAEPGEEEQVDAKRHILYYTLCTGFRHDQIPYSKGVLREIGREGGAFRVTVTEDASKITPGYLAQFDAIALNTTGQPFPTAEAKQAFLDFVRGGKGVIGVHSATDTHYDWPEFGEMLGGWFDGHPWHQVVGFKVDDPTHPACRMVPADWKIKDEIYQFRNWDRGKCHMLLTIDNGTIDVNAKGVKREDKDFAVAWTREFGKGRVFFTSLGHTREVWDSPIFRQHLRQGILWTMGDTE